MKEKPITGDTAEFPAAGTLAGDPWPDTGSARVQVELAALSHQGLVRANNEDHYLVVRFGRALETVLTNLPADQVPARAEEVGYGLVVADGMGGTAAGEVASRMAIRTLVSLALHTPDWILSTAEQETERVMERMAERLRSVGAALRDQGRGDPSLAGMGTTMTLACSLGARLVIGHIGDSRAYLFRGGGLHQLTRDHTLVQSLVDAGCLTAEEAAIHPFRHRLTRSLGGRGDPYAADLQRAWLSDRDQLLLCTDGLTEMVDNATIGHVLGGAATADEACQTLVALALDNGGKDNVTVALARYRLPS
jgi:PPM family protein phosphatase